MSDRRNDDESRLPRRPLSGKQEQAPESGPVSERVSAAMAAVPSGSAGPRQPGDTEQLPAAQDRPGSSSGRQGTPSAPRAGSVPPAAGGIQRGAEVPRGKRVRRARLRLTHVDPWSVMKTAFLLSIALGIVIVVAVAVVWSVLGAAGVWESINRTVSDVLGGETAGSFDVENYIGTSRVMGFTMLVAAVDVVLVTSIATLGAFLYNLSAALLGGIEVTLAEDES